jgi:hypothetical protein
MKNTRKEEQIEKEKKNKKRQTDRQTERQTNVPTCTLPPIARSNEGAGF